MRYIVLGYCSDVVAARVTVPSIESESIGDLRIFTIPGDSHDAKPFLRRCKDEGVRVVLAVAVPEHMTKEQAFKVVTAQLGEKAAVYDALMQVSEFHPKQ